jgi:glycosyltransferase involved in cell wall biosynthesis
MNILIVYPHNPFLNNSGVNSRFLELLKYFKNRKIDIDILSHEKFIDNWDNYDESLINHLYLNDFYNYKAFYLRIKRKILNLIKKSLESYAYPNLIKQFQNIVQQNQYDYILISYVNWADLLKHINTNKVKTILTVEDFISMNNYERNSGKYNLGKSINEEIERINLFNKAICISKEEANFFERACKDVEFHHIPHFLENKFSEVKKDTDIVFVGSDNPFNRDGMIWFFEYVMPHLSDIYKIKIIGKVNEHLEKYKNRFKNIEFISYVENLDDIYSKSKISICPLQGGTGLKIKVVESLSYGVPVLCTKYGIVGMDSKYNGCIVVDEPQEFANEVKNILEDEERYKNLQNEAQEYFIENFSKESVYKKLDKVFNVI